MAAEGLVLRRVPVAKTAHRPDDVAENLHRSSQLPKPPRGTLRARKRRRNDVSERFAEAGHPNRVPCLANVLQNRETLCPELGDPDFLHGPRIHDNRAAPYYISFGQGSERMPEKDGYEEAMRRALARKPFLKSDGDYPSREEVYQRGNTVVDNVKKSKDSPAEGE